MAKKDGTVDLRIQKTQKSIKQAFFDLIEEEGFDHIAYLFSCLLYTSPSPRD